MYVRKIVDYGRASCRRFVVKFCVVRLYLLYAIAGGILWTNKTAERHANSEYLVHRREFLNLTRSLGVVFSSRVRGDLHIEDGL